MYEPNTWEDGGIITKERLNHLEAGVANEQEGPPGAIGPQGLPGKPGEGLTGQAASLAKLTNPATTDTPAVAIKVNEIIDALHNRGISLL